MIVITGAAGFIASVIAARLNKDNYNDLILVDDFSRQDRERNYSELKYTQLVDRDQFMQWFDDNHSQVEFVIHMGARSATTEFDYSVLEKLNLNYTKDIWKRCVEYGIGLIYASSAATYGDGTLGYDDNHDLPYQLQPLNPYGVSKNEFDKWALKEEKQPYFWAGLKFFNVYGPNEYHKGKMASVILHSFNQITKTGGMKLFRSHREGIADGHQSRDFVYVKDIAEVILYMMLTRKGSGLYNVGTGKARTFLDLTKATFKAMGVEENISFVDTPVEIRDKYQYFTEANIQKLRAIGYDKPMTELEDGVADYVKNYIMQNRIYNGKN
ncbi:MAG: ADP-glyceromanno-heptose 6-epimerase [Bacteroidales bacterium]|nr:ADP-glyceromanno-heptose 6-epimerase [Bacteroidales bacterium]